MVALKLIDYESQVYSAVFKNRSVLNYYALLKKAIDLKNNKSILIALIATIFLSFYSSLAHSFLGKQSFVSSDTVNFTNRSVMQGIRATESQCNETTGAVWAKYGDADGECIRYWSTGLSSAVNNRVIFFFHGDILAGNSVLDKSYEKKSPATMLDRWKNFFPDNTKPSIYIARPGTYGSSGDHSQRRRPAESKIISAAIDVLKKKYNIEEIVVTGQSGGGHVTASLITHRSDIVCAVPASAPASPRMRAQIRGFGQDTTNYPDSYEPTENLKNRVFHPKLRVFVVADENDINVPFASQTVLADKLKEQKVSALVIRGDATGSEKHRLLATGFKIASFCFDDLSDEEITRRAVGLRG